MVSALNVGNSILQRGFKENIDITPMKLQKLIYLVYKKYYQDTGKALFSERFEVWKYGPVLTSVYDEFKKYRSNAILSYARDSEGRAIGVNEDSSRAFKIAIDYVWDKYRFYDGIPLSEMTHRSGTAWWIAAKAGNVFLSDEDIMREAEFI